MLELEDRLRLGAGNERECYIHPHDAARCIKVNRPGVVHREQNRIERYYFRHLERRGLTGRYLPRFYGEASTTLGPGLVFERIVDHDGQASVPLAHALDQGAISRAEARRLVDELFDFLLEEGVCLGDVNRDQVLVRDAGSQWRPVIIDGLGTRRHGLKLWLVTRLKWLSRRKTLKNRAIFMKKLLP